MNRNDVCGGVLILVFGAFTVVLSLRMPIGTFRAAGPGLFPLCLGLLLIVLAGGFILEILVRCRRIQKTQAASAKPGRSVKPVAGFMASIALAAGFLEYIGYAPTAFLLVFALLQVLGCRRWRSNMLIALLAGGISHFIFVQWLQIPFPQGWLGI